MILFISFFACIEFIKFNSFNQNGLHFGLLVHFNFLTLNLSRKKNKLNTKPKKCKKKMPSGAFQFFNLLNLTRKKNKLNTKNNVKKMMFFGEIYFH